MQPRLKTSEFGKVTPKQLAIIVDKYFCDNNLAQTRSFFRREASPFFSDSSLHHMAKSLMSLVAMLSEFLIMKEEKMILSRERTRLEQERSSLDNFLRCMQQSISDYNVDATLTPCPSVIRSSVTSPSVVQLSGTGPNFAAPQFDPRPGSSAGYTMRQSAIVTRSNQSEPISKRKVTPVHVATIVDVYLRDNNFSQTHSVFTREASSLFGDLPRSEKPKGMLTLGEILSEFISLKEEKVLFGPEWARLEQEKSTLDNFRQCIHQSINDYNVDATLTPVPSVIHLSVKKGAPAGCTMHQSVVVSPSTPLRDAISQQSSSTLAVNSQLTRKRMCSNIAASDAKRPRRGCPRKTEVKGTHEDSCISGSSTRAGTFINQPTQPNFSPGSSTSPIVPHQLENTWTPQHYNTPQNITSVDCSVVKEPVKKTFSKIEFVKRRLDYDCPDVFISLEKETPNNISVREPANNTTETDMAAAAGLEKQTVDNEFGLESTQDATVTDMVAGLEKETVDNISVPESTRDATVTDMVAGLEKETVDNISVPESTRDAIKTDVAASLGKETVDNGFALESTQDATIIDMLSSLEKEMVDNNFVPESAQEATQTVLASGLEEEAVNDIFLPESVNEAHLLAAGSAKVGREVVGPNFPFSGVWCSLQPVFDAYFANVSQSYNDDDEGIVIWDLWE